eukprot:391915-Rhodomonas_salina.1
MSKRATAAETLPQDRDGETLETQACSGTSRSFAVTLLAPLVASPVWLQDRDSSSSSHSLSDCCLGAGSLDLHCRRSFVAIGCGIIADVSPRHEARRDAGRVAHWCGISAASTHLLILCYAGTQYSKEPNKNVHFKSFVPTAVFILNHSENE